MPGIPATCRPYRDPFEPDLDAEAFLSSPGKSASQSPLWAAYGHCYLQTAIACFSCLDHPAWQSHLERYVAQGEHRQGVCTATVTSFTECRALIFDQDKL